MKRIRIAVLMVLLLMFAGCSAGPELSFSESNAVPEEVMEMAAAEAEEISVAKNSASQPVEECADASQENQAESSVSVPADDDSANEPDVLVNVSESVPVNDQVLPADALNNALKNACKKEDATVNATENATVNSEEPKPVVTEASESVSQPVISEEPEPVTAAEPSPNPESEAPNGPDSTSEPQAIVEPVVEPAPEPEPEPEPTPEPSFDISYWISYARGVASSKGLNLDSSAVDCWDNPITANPDCIYLERDISARLSRYAGDEDITDVWIWYECVGTNKYLIYIGYA